MYGMGRTIKGLLLSAVVLVASSHASAADILQTNSKLCAFALEGPIVFGDYDRLAGLIARSPLDNLNERTVSICLKSMGGSYIEGLKVGGLIYRRGLSTVVADGSECFSACAIVFMAGVVSDKPGSASVRPIMPHRKLSAEGILGFHAPYLSMPDEKYSKDQVETAAQSMRKAILGLAELASKQTMLSAGDFIKKSLVTGILGKGPQEVLFVKTIGDAARWNIEIYDAAEQFPKEFGAAMAGNVAGQKNLCNNFHYSHIDKTVPRNTSYSLKFDQYESQYPPNARFLVQDNNTSYTVCETYAMTMKTLSHVAFLACSYDYWSRKNFGDCREYKTALLIGRAEFVPDFFTLDPFTPLKKFKSGQ